MTAAHPRPPTVESYNDRIREACRPMTLNQWRVAKALVYSAVLVAVAAMSLVYDADPTYIGGFTLAGILVVFVGEVKEIEVASFVTVTFRPKGADNEED